MISDYKKEMRDAIKADSLKLLQTGLVSIHVLIYYSLIYVTVSFLKISFRITGKKVLTIALKAQWQPFSVLDACHNTISLQTIHHSQTTQHVTICLTLVINQSTVI